jgi:hypothetical protein
VATLAFTAVGTAVAGDISCIGVQGVAAQWRLQQLPEDQKAQFAPVMQRLNDIAQAAQTEMTDAEKPVQQDLNALKAANPGVTDEQLGKLWTDQVVHSDSVDAHLADSLHTQYDVHDKEALMIANSSQIVTDSDRQKMSETTDAYVAQHAEYAKLQDSASFRRLVGIMAASNASQSGSEMAAPALASLGFDTASDDPVATAAAGLTQSAVAANAIGTEGKLRVDHLMSEDMRQTDFRKAVMDHGGKAAGEVMQDLGGGLNNITLAHYVPKKIVQVEPPPPPPSDAGAQAGWRDQLVQKAQQAAASTQLIIVYAKAKIIDAVKNSGGASGH